MRSASTGTTTLPSTTRSRTSGIGRRGIDHVVFTSYDGRENNSKDSATFVARRFPTAYIDPPVPRRTTVATAQSAGTPITAWEPHNAASIGFMKVTKTIVERDKILA